jgi:hypothetical protein
LKRRDGKTRPVQEGLLAQPLLRGVQDVGARPHWDDSFDGLNGLDGDIFKLERDNAYVPREFRDGVQILVRGSDFHVGNLPGRCVVIG